MAHDRVTNTKPVKPKIATKPQHLKKNATCRTIKVNRNQPNLIQQQQLIMKRAASLDYINHPNFKENKHVKPGIMSPVPYNIPSPNYVEINLPEVKPGTIIRSDSKTGELRSMPAGQTKQNSTISRNLVQKTNLENNDKRDSNEANNNYVTTNYVTNDSIDADGYEMPIGMRKNVYFAFEPVTSSNVTSSADETDAYEDAKALQKYRKKKRHDRRNDAALNDFHRSAMIKNKISPRASLSSEESCHGYRTESPANGVTKLNSFLSTRLKTLGRAESRDTNSPSDVFSSDDESSDWFSSDEEDCECYYQQIDAPATKFVDHDYEDIEESDDTGARKKNKKTMRKMVVSAVRGRKKVKQRSSDPLTSQSTAVTPSPNVSRRNVFDVITTPPSSGEVKWSDISTPGVLKFKEFRRLGKTASMPEINKL